MMVPKPVDPIVSASIGKPKEVPTPKPPMQAPPTAAPVRKDGQPDMRLKANQQFKSIDTANDGEEEYYDEEYATENNDW